MSETELAVMLEQAIDKIYSLRLRIDKSERERRYYKLKLKTIMFFEPLNQVQSEAKKSVVRIV